MCLCIFPFLAYVELFVGFSETSYTCDSTNVQTAANADLNIHWAHMAFRCFLISHQFIFEIHLGKPVVSSHLVYSHFVYSHIVYSHFVYSSFLLNNIYLIQIKI